MDSRIAILSTTTAFTAKTKEVMAARSLDFPVYEASLDEAVRLAKRLAPIVDEAGGELRLGIAQLDRERDVAGQPGGVPAQLDLGVRP